MKRIVLMAAIVGAGSFGCASFNAPCSSPPPVSFEGERPLTVRAEGGTLWTSGHLWAEPRRTWAMPARGPVGEMAVQAAATGRGHVVTFKQGGVLWRGELDGDRAPRGPLQALEASSQHEEVGAIATQR